MRRRYSAVTTRGAGVSASFAVVPPAGARGVPGGSVPPEPSACPAIGRELRGPRRAVSRAASRGRQAPEGSAGGRVADEVGEAGLRPGGGVSMHDAAAGHAVDQGDGRRQVFVRGGGVPGGDGLAEAADGGAEAASVVAVAEAADFVLPRALPGGSAVGHRVVVTGFFRRRGRGRDSRRTGAAGGQPAILPCGGLRPAPDGRVQRCRSGSGAPVSWTEPLKVFTARCGPSSPRWPWKCRGPISPSTSTSLSIRPV